VNIIDRNFYRLLRAGAFNTEEHIEALSAWKWNRLYQLAEMHDVAPVIYKGIERCRDQFLLQVPQPLMDEWQQATSHDDDDDNPLLTADHLTNPMLNHKLQSILDDDHSNTETRTLLLHLLGIARFIMNAGIPVKRVVQLGVFLRQTKGRIDYEKLQSWTQSLQLSPMVQLAAIMLVKLLHFSADELPFMEPINEERMNRQIRDIFQQKNSHAEEWYFSQGKNIFVHTSNPSAMMWHVRRSARNLRYYPSETLTNFFTTFLHSLSHIEE
jgi:hypothetical protein